MAQTLISPDKLYINIYIIILQLYVVLSRQVISEKSLSVITGQHPFVNGNKRTRIATEIMILRNEGYRLEIVQQKYITLA